MVATEKHCWVVLFNIKFSTRESCRQFVKLHYNNTVLVHSKNEQVSVEFQSTDWQMKILGIAPGPWTEAGLCLLV